MLGIYKTEKLYIPTLSVLYDELKGYTHKNHRPHVKNIHSIPVENLDNVPGLFFINIILYIFHLCYKLQAKIYIYLYISSSEGYNNVEPALLVRPCAFS